ncbi:MAG: hypothetical protein UZ16_OP3001000123 [Candidatus Hinthialibacteria bacterium OLB16]|nr:MAG: hypothetical protein UZ16_OP3001000123 [Candidatus Hinthialibacteria bacterium OLB16]
MSTFFLILFSLPEWPYFSQFLLLFDKIFEFRRGITGGYQPDFGNQWLDGFILMMKITFQIWKSFSVNLNLEMALEVVPASIHNGYRFATASLKN